MGNVDAVPAGKYGKAALEHLGAWDGVKGKIAQAENVRAALLLVSRGEAPLGIVYNTDAVSDADVKIVVHVSGRKPSADRLPGGDHHERLEAPVRRGFLAFLAPKPRGTCSRQVIHHFGPTGSAIVSVWLSPEEWTAVRLSLKVAFTAMAASLVPGIAIAFLLERRRFWGRRRARCVGSSSARSSSGRRRLLFAARVGQARDPSAPSSPTISASSFRSAGRARRWPAPSWVSPARARYPVVAWKRWTAGSRIAAGTLGASPAWVFVIGDIAV